MRSECTFIMSPVDEAAFLKYVFEKASVYLIPSLRNPTKRVPHSREISALENKQCMLWDREILPAPVTEFIPSCDDYYLRSDESLIQLLRSPSDGKSLGAGRIALATNQRGAGDTNPHTAKAMKSWYRALQKWIKANFVNTFVYASDFQPEVGTAEARVWVGPDALALHRQGWKLHQHGPTEYSLQYYEPEAKDAFLAKYREAYRFIAIGVVESIEESGQHSWHRRVSLRLAESMGYELPLDSYEGVVSTSQPVPQLGDEVACTFQENTMGRVTAAWEAKEIKKLTAKGRERTIQSLKKKWLHL